MRRYKIIQSPFQVNDFSALDIDLLHYAEICLDGCERIEIAGFTREVFFCI